MNFSHLAEKSLAGDALSQDEARSILATPENQLPELLAAAQTVRETYFGKRVKLCVLLNAQSGICPEDCHYCSQSKISKAPVEKYKLLPENIIFGQAKKAAQNGAKRFCMVIAARGPQDRDIEHLSNAVRQIKSDPATQNLEICTSLGLMDLEKCQKLKAAGVDYVNHNLNTSAEHYAKICTSHTYADRVETLDNVKKAGLKTCSGGIVGMGESHDDIIELAYSLREKAVESIPINFLLTIEGTPLADQTPIEPLLGLKVLCLMRLLNPQSEVRVAAGREVHLKERQAQALCAANSLFVDGYLTTPGDAAAPVREWVEAAGFEIEN